MDCLVLPEVLSLRLSERHHLSACAFRATSFSAPAAQASTQQQASCHFFIVRHMVCLTLGTEAVVSSVKGSGGDPWTRGAVYLAHRCLCLLVSSLYPTAWFWRGEMGGRDLSQLERKRLWFINSCPKAVTGNVFTHYLPIQLQPLRSRIRGADAQSGKASRSMFNKVRLWTIDYTTGRALQPLSMPLAALKTVFPETCGDFTEMLLGWDTHNLFLDLSGLCCPILVQRQITQENGICRRVTLLCRESAAVCAVSHVGLVIFLSQWYHLIGWSENSLDPFLEKAARKGW